MSRPLRASRTGRPICRLALAGKEQSAGTAARPGKAPSGGRRWRTGKAGSAAVARYARFIGRNPRVTRWKH